MAATPDPPSPLPRSLRAITALVREGTVDVVVSDLDGVVRLFPPGLWAELDAGLGIEDPHVRAAAGGAAPGSGADGPSFSAILGHPILPEVVRGRATHDRWRREAVRALEERGAAPERAAATVDRWAAIPGRADPVVVRRLLELRDAGTPVLVLTNGTDRVPEEVAAIGLTALIGEHREWLLNSADLGAAKPEPEAFARAHAMIRERTGLPVPPSRVAFVDDSPGHVEAARRFGWHALVHPGDAASG
ncbi:HAD-IA family hydrolase [Brachybacterium sp. NBEC-018]|uniref:HAD family hydrolase n=1 Tax=Brachybacterium sp. NBEC-018 TaxID=2996004 RepID=UPI0021755D59|nr:HAD-IA family hydrolase [Brachybacterium sp. NBEC-018]UVY82787.1 HAD-IA family hydrolase [Brachybacterium sp. NBEC-018]